MKKKKIFVFIIISAAIIVSVLYFVKSPPSNAEEVVTDLGISTEVVTVEKKDLRESIRYTGHIDAKNSTVISSKVTSQLQSLNFTEGDYVEEGTVIAKLDDLQLLAAKETSKRKIETLRVTYNFLKDEVANYQTTNPAVKNIELLESDYAFLISENANVEGLYTEGIVSESAYDQSIHKQEMLEKQLVQARAASDYALKQLQNQMNTAKAQLSEMNSMLKEMDLTIAFTEIIAPSSGVIRTLFFGEGDLVISGKPFLVIDDRSVMTAKVNIAEEDLSNVAEGNPAFLKIAGSEASVEAPVTRVMPSLNMNTRVCGIEIDLSGDLSKGLVLGSSVAVEFITNTVSDKLIIPKQAILTQLESDYVFVIVDGHAVKTEIQTGLIVDDNAEVVKGLNEGEIIAVKNLSKLYDGAKIYLFKGVEN